MRKAITFLFLLAALPVALRAQNKKTFNMLMRNTGAVTLWDGKKIVAWGFTRSLGSNVAIPNPAINVVEGDSVIVSVLNFSQGNPHTIHWHGLDVDQANDGVPGLSPEVQHMKTQVYRFKATHPGLFFYHCHVLSIVHVQMGMYGMVSVRAKDSLPQVWTGGPRYTRDFSWLFSEIDTAWHSNVPGGNKPHADSMNKGHDTVRVPAYRPSYFLLNGRSETQLRGSNQTLQVNPGDTVYLRLGNMGFLYNTVTFPKSVIARVLESDGRPLPKSYETNAVRIMPGERYGVLLTAKESSLDSISISYNWMHNDLPANVQKLPVRSKVSGIAELDDAVMFSVYPNPSNGTISLQTSAPFNEGILTMKDMSGRLLWSLRGNAESMLPVIILPSFPRGMYLLHLQTENGSGYQKLLIK